MLRIDGIKIEYTDFSPVYEKELELIGLRLCGRLHIEASDIKRLKIHKRSIDARFSPIVYAYSIFLWLGDNSMEKSLCKRKNGSWNISRCEPPMDYDYGTPLQPADKPPIVVGAGPAGLFAAWGLAKRGLKPIIMERGKAIEDRIADVETFWKEGRLLADSNVLFGEGGAGTFSDGKLNTLNKDVKGRLSEVLRILADMVGDCSITYDSKPHIGTDLLRKVVINLRHAIIEMGGQFLFSTRMEHLLLDENRVVGVVANGKSYYTDSLVLAIGHSARDTFRELYSAGVPMQAKAFAVGFRAVHPQGLIDANQYNMPEQEAALNIKNKLLPTASYKLTATASNGRGVYSFCMCPGGYVINASGEQDGICVNGMSYHNRDSGYANSAIIVAVSPEDYPGNGPLGGIDFQQQLERAAYEAGKGCIPIQYFEDFKNLAEGGTSKTNPAGEQNIDCGRTFKGRTCWSDLSGILPKELNCSFIEGMESFGKKIKGFDTGALLAGIESRTSSPVRVERDRDGQSSIKNLYPCGEGAGYAGGITSAAMDGLYIAECIAAGKDKAK